MNDASKEKIRQSNRWSPSESRTRDLTGERFGNLVVTAAAGSKDGSRMWHCACDCGKAVTFATTDLQTARCRSCGCGRHRTKHARARSPEYGAWRHIKSRCYNVNCSEYPNYGARGIVMCDEWINSFEAFFAEVGERPSALHSIDRIDNNGNYEPGNVRWATQTVQNRNKRVNVYIEYGGERRTLSEWSKRLGMPFNTLRARVKRWGVEKAITTPINKTAQQNRLRRRT